MKIRLTLAMLLLPVAAAAQTDQVRYSSCVQQSSSNPQAALTIANGWTSGGMPAMHCKALALIGLKRYAEAANELDAISKRKDVAPSVLSEVLAQAGNAWLLAGNPQKADSALSASLVLNARDPDVFAGLARAKAAQKDWAGAEANLNSALAITPSRADLLVLRASARHAQKKKTEARADVEKALNLQPGMADALVERGSMKREAGDISGARTDWRIGGGSRSLMWLSAMDHPPHFDLADLSADAFRRTSPP